MGAKLGGTAGGEKTNERARRHPDSAGAIIKDLRSELKKARKLKFEEFRETACDVLEVAGTGLVNEAVNRNGEMKLLLRQLGKNAKIFDRFSRQVDSNFKAVRKELTEVEYAIFFQWVAGSGRAHTMEGKKKMAKLLHLDLNQIIERGKFLLNPLEKV
jgi:hypothetical protein